MTSRNESLDRQSRLTICFVVDGGVQIGMGHIQQSITLANRLQVATTFFITKSDEMVLRFIREAGFNAARFQDDIEIFECLKSLNPDIIIFDKIDVDEKLAKKIRAELVSRLIIFTNLTGANQHAHIAVLPRSENLYVDPISRFKNISYINQITLTHYFFGPKYWILRPEFFEYKKLKKITPKTIEHILVAFGGSDPTNLTCQVLERLLNMNFLYKIDIVLGQKFCFHNEVSTILNKFIDKKENISLHSNIKNMAELLYGANLVITAAGMTMFEALCVGTSVIVIPQDQLQKDTYQGVVRMLEIDCLGDLERMIGDLDFSYSDDPGIMEMNIGEGLQELVDVILA